LGALHREGASNNPKVSAAPVHSNLQLLPILFFGQIVILPYISLQNSPNKKSG
jgi:hypothetical protein